MIDRAVLIIIVVWSAYELAKLILSGVNRIATKRKKNMRLVYLVDEDFNTISPPIPVHVKDWTPSVNKHGQRWTLVE